ncbi:MAG: Arc family DNA-binding protein [Alphaproteobacteria bacterium]|nr:Arc family DNA-binding protein [Alphaproteobacteria bacterium]MBU1550183.1 Arc family DNA-binding protein [Alphaproteobacteria bacterium]MBU2337896.1 Arc family DNA-binding protein [Alphaproteobacteria bacterium]MBU2387876.1 Arc family DNA-binding protein [Alphaproteobacteria bacterium]
MIVSQDYSSRTADRAQVRFPQGMRDQIKQEARRNQRTMNAEIIYRLSEAYSATETKKADARS